MKGFFVMETFFTVIGITLAAAGAVISLFAKFITGKLDIAKKQIIKGIEEGKPKEDLKLQKAILKVKLIGAAVFVPGMIILYIILKD
jgi:hypothetical protein